MCPNVLLVVFFLDDFDMEQSSFKGFLHGKLRHKCVPTSSNTFKIYTQIIQISLRFKGSYNSVVLLSVSLVFHQ